MRIGFIGCGNMAKALIDGVLAASLTTNEEIFCSDKDIEKLQQYCAVRQIQCCQSNLETVKQSEIILLCVKPQCFPEVLGEIQNSVENRLIISIAAGKTIAFIENYLPKARIIRVMPNLNAAIAESDSAICANSRCTDQDPDIAEKIFQSIGNVYRLREEDFSAFSAVACCSPAFSFMYADALAQAGIAKGLSADVARRCAAHSVLASAKMLLESDESAQRLIQRVCSPGGTTIEGVQKLNKTGFREAVDAAVTASYNKDKIL